MDSIYHPAAVDCSAEERARTLDYSLTIELQDFDLDTTDRISGGLVIAAPQTTMFNFISFTESKRVPTVGTCEVQKFNKLTFGN